ncbi:MAG: rod shape-determining protein MreD [Gallionella sp.]
MHNKSELQRPVGNTFIVLSIFVALLLNGLPWHGLALMLRPDFVAMILLYWCMYKPMRIGIGLAWAVGIFADVADASSFGQHALTYTLLAFGGVVLHRRLQMFDLRQQTSQVLIIFGLTYLTYGLVHWLINGEVIWGYFLGLISSTVLWMPFSALLQMLQQVRFRAER